MTARQELQCCYEYAFHPPSLNRLWCQIKRQEIDVEDVKPLLDKAMMLHLALPESGFASQRALQRLALYQAKSRAFGMPAFIRNIRKALGCGKIEASTVPGALVRDIGLPPFSRPCTACAGPCSPCGETVIGTRQVASIRGRLVPPRTPKPQ